MTIIVTGGAGFIGSNFIFYMLNKHPEYRIVCLDKLTYAGNLSTLAPVMDNPQFRFVKADICDSKAVEGLFEEEHPDIVVNFAAELLWMPVENTVSKDIIRFQPMRYTAICRLTDLICFSQRKHRFTPHHHTVHQRQEQICWFLLITEHTACR